MLVMDLTIIFLTLRRGGAEVILELEFKFAQ